MKCYFEPGNELYFERFGRVFSNSNGIDHFLPRSIAPSKTVPEGKQSESTVSFLCKGS